MHHKKHRGSKKIYAIFILLAITVGASLSAFFWLTSVEKHVEYGNKLAIEEVTYNPATHDMTVNLINGLATGIPVKSSGSARERTVVTIYPFGEPTAMPDCTWVGLADLSCAGVCEGTLEPKSEVKITFKGTRDKCQLDPETHGDTYHLELFFGKQRVEQNFKI